MIVCKKCGEVFRAGFDFTSRVGGVLRGDCPECGFSFPISTADMEEKNIHGCCESIGGKVYKMRKVMGNQGAYFKSPLSFRAYPDAPCYCGENMDEYWTYNDFMQLAEGNEEIAEDLFCSLEWQHPETLFEEYLRDGEYERCAACGKLIHAKCEEVEKCPHCGIVNAQKQEAA